MAATVLFHRLASREFNAACRWYAAKGADLEQAFRDEVDRAVTRGLAFQSPVVSCRSRSPVRSGTGLVTRGSRAA